MSLLTIATASQLADIALANVTREFPGKMDHVLAGPQDIQGPRAFHPIFYGSFDWHSCVHGFWLLAKILRLYPDVPAAANIRALFDTHITAANVAAETRYFDRPMQGNFERPYGWAWLLMLASELARSERAEAKTWHGFVRPLAVMLAQRFGTYLKKLPFPIRAGTHPNT